LHEYWSATRIEAFIEPDLEKVCQDITPDLSPVESYKPYDLSVPAGTSARVVPGTPILSGKYPVVLWQLGNLGNSALQIYIESTPEGWWNLQHVPNEYVDSRWEQILTADPETSKKLQQEINQYQVDQAWFAPMVYMGKNYAYDAAKVATIRAAIAQGRYPVDADRIAERMIALDLPQRD